MRWDVLYETRDDVLVPGIDVDVACAVLGDDLCDLARVKVDDDGGRLEGAIQKHVLCGEDAARRHGGGGCAGGSAHQRSLMSVAALSVTIVTVNSSVDQRREGQARRV